jgi:hypothetical protein
MIAAPPTRAGQGAVLVLAALLLAAPRGAGATVGAGPADAPDPAPASGPPAPTAAPAEGPPTAAALLEELRTTFDFSSLSVLARMSVRRGGAVHVLAFSLWTRADGKTLLRVREPQRLAGRAILRVGGAVWLHEPAWGRLHRVSPEGERAPWGEVLLRVVDTVTGDPLPARYSPLVLRPAQSAGAAWTLVLAGRDGRDLRCQRLEVDVAAGTHTVLEARCDRGVDGTERWRFDRHRDFGGRLLPTEVVVDTAGDEGWSATLQLTRLGVDVPLDDALFTRAALGAQR